MKLKNLYAAAAVLALAVGVGLLTPSGTAHAQPPLVPHYECYDFPMASPQQLPTSVLLETQFGVEEVGLGPMPVHLCLPAVKNGEGSLEVPHVECLPIGGDTPDKTVTLITQFGRQDDVEVGSPIQMCMPVSKEVYYPVQEPPTALAPMPHYECYAISGEAPQVPVLIETQFTQFGPPHEVVVGEPTRLCLPAIKNGEGVLEDLEDVAHVECFAIQADPSPEIWLNLTNQFGVQTELMVGPAIELCVPAIKIDMDVSIGGIAEAPDADASALEATASDGSSGTTYAAIAGIAAAAMLLGAGGWYARRRWLS